MTNCSTLDGVNRMLADVVNRYIVMIVEFILHGSVTTRRSYE